MSTRARPKEQELSPAAKAIPLAPAPATNSRLSHVLSVGFQRGLDAQNVGCAVEAEVGVSFSEMRKTMGKKATSALNRFKGKPKENTIGALDDLMLLLYLIIEHYLKKYYVAKRIGDHAAHFKIGDGNIQVDINIMWFADDDFRPTMMLNGTEVTVKPGASTAPELYKKIEKMLSDARTGFNFEDVKLVDANSVRVRAHTEPVEGVLSLTFEKLKEENTKFMKQPIGVANTAHYAGHVAGRYTNGGHTGGMGSY